MSNYVCMLIQQRRRRREGWSEKQKVKRNKFEVFHCQESEWDGVMQLT